MKIKFLIQYLLHPRTTGAVLPSSQNLSSEIVKNIDFKECHCIVEFGPGTGVFTREILNRCNKDTKIILIEYNEKFYKILREKYSYMKNVHVINDSAENINYYINKYGINNVDYIVSGLPFASLPKAMTEKILINTKSVLGHKGTFIMFQYTKLKMSLIGDYFKNINISRELINIPPAYVFTCTNKL